MKTHLTRRQFLVYTRKDKLNANVMRWCAPLHVAEVNRKTPRLIRRSEQITVPMAGNDIHSPAYAPQLGNFHVANASPDESWGTVGDFVAPHGWRGSLRLARICWRKPNRLATTP